MELIQLVRKNINKFNQQIFVLKILLSFKKVEDYIEKLEYVEKINESLNATIEEYLRTNNNTIYNIIDNDYYTVESLINELREDIVPNFKITSVIMLDNMKIDEISLFYCELKSVLSKYEDINIASNDIFYYSGKEISEYTVRLLKYIELHEIPNKNLIPVKILEEKANVITLSIKEWLGTIQTLKTTLKYLNGLIDDEIDYLRKEFITLNVYYFIVITGGNN